MESPRIPLRNQGQATANDTALDGDVILAAQASSVKLKDYSVIVVTTNKKHLSLLVDARTVFSRHRPNGDRPHQTKMFRWLQSMGQSLTNARTLP